MTLTCDRPVECGSRLTDGKPCPGTLEFAGEDRLHQVDGFLPALRFKREGCPRGVVRIKRKVGP